MSDPLEAYGGMPIGLKVQLQFSASAPRLSSNVVGLRKNKYLIIKRPKTAHLIGFTDTYFNEAPVILRYMSEGAVLGFRSQITYIIKQPDRLFFLQYPRTIEEFSLRKCKRVDCFFPGELMIGALSGDIAIVDISMEGCRGMVNLTNQKLTENLLSDKKHDAIVSFALNSTTAIEFPCTIMRVIQDKQHLMVGLQFHDLVDAVSLYVEKYIDMVECG